MRPRAAIIDVFSVKKAKILAVVNRQGITDVTGCQWKGKQLGAMQLHECTIVTAIYRISGRVIVSLKRPKC